MIGILFEVFLDIFSILFFEKIVNEKERSDEKCGIIPKEFYKGVIDKLWKWNTTDLRNVW